MSDAPALLPPRQSVFDRIRGAIILLALGIGGFLLYYSLFFERKTTYFSDRNARLIALLSDQIRRSITTTGSIVANAASLSSDKEIQDLYLYKWGSAGSQLPQAIFSSIAIETEKTRAAGSSDTRRSDALVIPFDRTTLKDSPQGTFQLTAAEVQGNAAPKHVLATVQLRRLIDTMVKHAATGVFDTVFIFDTSGNVIYQWTRQTADDSDAELKILRLRELQVPRLFEGEVTLQASELMTTSRQMAVRIGDHKYQLFSVPMRSGISIEKKEKTPPAAADQKAEPKAKSKTESKAESKPEPKPEETAEQKALLGIPSDTWVVCGAISNADFRAQSLAIPTTLLSGLGAVFLLVVLSWPFLKMALSSAQQKVTLVDVILLGLSGVLAMSVVCLIVLDTFTYLRLEGIADGHLETFSKQIEKNVRADIHSALASLDSAQKWAEQKLTVPQPSSSPSRLGTKPIPALNANLLNQDFDDKAPWFQSFALIDKEGWQRVKWTVDRHATPLIKVHTRSYFFGPLHEGREYLKLDDGRRVAIQSVQSITTGLPEVVFARRTDAMPGYDERVAGRLPVIAMSMPTAMSLIDPVVPEGFGFAIVDENGRVLFHSVSARNTVENLFAETSDNPQVRSSVLARQDRTMNIRYLGEDYTAHVRPMGELPWTLVTFRERRWLRTLNTEALLITVTLVLVVALALIVFLGFVLLLRPRYRAEWLWPDPKRVGAYAELAAAYFFLLAIALVLLVTLEKAALLLFPFCFIPLVLLITYLYLRPKLHGVKWGGFATAATLCAALLIVQMWSADNRAIVPIFGASILLAIVVVRAAWRPPEARSSERARERQTALPLCYVWAAFLLLLLTSLVPTTAFFKSAYHMEIDSYVKRLQMKLANDLQQRWWRISSEFSEARGEGKFDSLEDRWKNENRDIYVKGMFGTSVDFLDEQPRQPDAQAGVIPAAIEQMLPVDDASVNNRELVSDQAADGSWWWMRDARTHELQLVMKNRAAERPFRITSVVPQLLPAMDNISAADLAVWRNPSPAVLIAITLLAICWIAFAIARFIARRVFLVDLVHPLALSQGYVGLRHVVCHPCDDDSARRLFRDFKKIDLRTAEGLELARTAPQTFHEREMAVFIDGVDYSCGSGERSEILRTLIDRLTRNSDRTVVIRPTALTVVTRALLKGDDREAWAEVLAPFVWVNWSQLITTARTLTLSGATAVFEDDRPPEKKRASWRSLYTLAGFDTYFEQFTDTRGAIRRLLKAETDGDPYLQTLVAGLGADASACDQVLDEIGERAEEYYAALWLTCSPHEQLVMMQLAQTGLVNNKTRKHVRRLLARGHLRRDPQLRVMNESFRRFVLGQFTTSKLAAELEHNLASDAWSRFRIPLFAGAAIVLLFFFMTQRQMFDSSIALITGLAASLPAFVKMVSGLGDRAKA